LLLPYLILNENWTLIKIIENMMPKTPASTSSTKKTKKFKFPPLKGVPPDVIEKANNQLEIP